MYYILTVGRGSSSYKCCWYSDNMDARNDATFEKWPIGHELIDTLYSNYVH